MAVTGSASPITAAHFVLSVDGAEVVTFSELNEISSEVEPAEGTSTGSTGTATHTDPYGTASPPTATLTRAVDGSTYMWAWHTAVLDGDPAARRTGTLALQDPSGQTLLTFALVNAWVSSVNIAGQQSGDSQLVMETYLLVCDAITMQAVSPPA
jgi:phage tail-like protein